MLFAPDTEESLSFVVVLGNTAAGASRSGRDELATVDQLAALLAGFAYTGRIDHDEAELREVRQSRDELRRVWTLDRDDAVEAVNAMLRDANALPFLARHGSLDWHLHATAPDAPLAQRLGAEAALALADVVRGEDLHRLRSCASDGCRGVLVDLSRNSSRRFCDTGCANRTHVAALRARRRAGATG